MLRQSITFTDDLAHRIREVQAALLVLDKRNVTFNDTVIRILTDRVLRTGPHNLAGELSHLKTGG